MKKRICLSLLVIILPLLLFGFLGCMKKPDHTPDYGPEVSLGEIEKAAINDMPPEPLEMKKGEYVSIDVTQSISDQPAQTMSQRLDEIVDRTDTATEAVWKFHVTFNELTEEGSWKQSKDEHNLAYSKNSPEATTTSIQSISEAANKKLGIYSIRALQASDQESPTKVTYHNLKREDGFMSVPLLVKNHADGKCGGVQNCEKGLRYMRLSFDRVVWDRPDKGIKTSFRITYSADVPTYIADWDSSTSVDLTNQLQFCAQTWLEIQSGSEMQVIPVQQCADVRDFQHGSGQ